MPVRIIVHPIGTVLGPQSPAYWTEVPHLPACSETGRDVTEAVLRTREAVRQWSHRCPQEEQGDAIEAEVELAM